MPHVVSCGQSHVRVESCPISIEGSESLYRVEGLPCFISPSPPWRDCFLGRFDRRAENEETRNAWWSLCARAAVEAILTCSCIEPYLGRAMRRETGHTRMVQKYGTRGHSLLRMFGQRPPTRRYQDANVQTPCNKVGAGHNERARQRAFCRKLPRIRALSRFGCKCMYASWEGMRLRSKARSEFRSRRSARPIGTDRQARASSAVILVRK